jgi:chemotaxis signal transduction protein
VRLTRSEPRRAISKRIEPVILFAVGKTTFAIAASAVDEIRNLDGLVSCSMSSAYLNLRKVKFTFERNRKNYLVVDANLHFHTPPTRATRILVLRNSSVAVLVDSIDRMCELTAVRKLPQAFTGEERSWYRGLTVVEDRLIPVINPQGFLSKAETAVALTDLVERRVADEVKGLATAKGVVSV